MKITLEQLLRSLKNGKPISKDKNIYEIGVISDLPNKVVKILQFDHKKQESLLLNSDEKYLSVVYNKDSCEFIVNRSYKEGSGFDDITYEPTKSIRKTIGIITKAIG